MSNKNHSILRNLLSVVFILLILCSCTQSNIKLENVITDFDKKNSNYKHLTNGGIASDDNLPYNIDAITGATMTVEGAGVVTSIPLSVREIENNVDGQVRGLYKDSKGVLNYEGLDLYYLLNNMKNGDNGINLTSKAYRVVLKNSNREDISSFTIDEIKNSHDEGRPIVLAYGVGDTTENTIAPFVYDGKNDNARSLGYVDKLKNDDGCIKLVYDLDKFNNNNYKTFSNVAYVYVCEEFEPGFKHTGNTIEPKFNDSQYVDYIVTFRGSQLKNEICMTVKDIENIVKYDGNNNVIEGGIGYRDSYSMANNAYWYVNTYEGVDLYKYLLYLGMEDAESMGLKNARTTLVQFIAADGAKSNETFSVDTLSYKDAFGFYKKNVQDKNDSKYVSTNEDLVKLGYPVLLAYGVNNYPYTITKADDAYVSGLSNSGGPLHVIFGKTEYNHPNGSNQVQYLDTVVVGDDILYNTHVYTDDEDIKKYADDELIIEIKNEDGKIINTKNITVKEIEDLIYGENTTKDSKKLYKIKNHYEVLNGEEIVNDIYEGVDICNFLLEYIKLNGLNGKITFDDGIDKLEINLEDLFKTGYNGTLNRENIKPIIAFAKNGKALVKDYESYGYVDGIALNSQNNEPNFYKVDNAFGPLMFLYPSTEIDNFNGKNMKNLKKITIDLVVDKYSHIFKDTDNLLNKKILFTGEGLEKEVEYKVADIEEMQTKIKTMILNINEKDNDSIKTYQDRYRGIPLYDLFKIIGIKNNAADVTIEGANGNKITVSLNRIKNKYEFEKGRIETAMLAFGKRPDDEECDMTSSKFHSNGKALTSKDGGPIKFIIPYEDDDSTNADLFIDNVIKVHVAANEIETWSHKMSDVYSEFLDYKFTITLKNDTSEVNKEYTLSDLEDEKGYIVRDKYHVLDIGDAEGIDIWKLIKSNFENVNNDNLISVIFYAEDGYKNDVLSVIGYSSLSNGVEFDGENKKVLLAYAINGYPLVNDENHEGYTGLAKNSDGPLRLIVESVQGASVKKCNKVVITISGDENLQ